MSSLEVTIEKLVIHEHPNADALELAQVGGYRAVVGKGVYKTGDFALYIPEQAVLPLELIEELGLDGKLAGKLKDRVKAIKLRGELSQGIVCRPEALKVIWDCQAALGCEDEQGCAAVAFERRTDFSEDLGITKWVPPVPVHLAGQVEPATQLLPWPDIENIKRFPEMFEPGEPVVATEKIHGTCCLLTLTEDNWYVSSKGNGAKKLVLKPDENNLYWRAVLQHRLVEQAVKLSEVLGARRVGLFGEIYGNGVQDLHYGADSKVDGQIGYALFDISYSLTDDGDEYFFLDPNVVRALTRAGVITVPQAPVLYTGEYDYEKLLALAEGPETVTKKKWNVREGLVVRSAIGHLHPKLGRKIGKFVGEGYLLRTGDATEYE